MTLRSVGDVPATRQNIFDLTLQSARDFKPLVGKSHTLRLANVGYKDADQPVVHGPRAVKAAILGGESIGRPLVGDYELVHNESGRVVSTKRSTLANVPYLTNEGTFIMKGNSYPLGNQLRQRAGVYARQKDNGELESHFNFLPGQGLGHRVAIDPKSGVFRLQVAQSDIPLYPFLQVMGASHSNLVSAWGKDVANANRATVEPRNLNKFYSKFVREKKPDASDDEKIEAIRREVSGMKLDPEVTRHTLGVPLDKPDLATYLAATHKLLRIQRGEANVDDRDSPAFQNIYGPEHLIAERFGRDRQALYRLLWRGSLTNDISGAPSRMFQKGLEAAIQGSGLGLASEAVNPAMLLDQRYRVTKLGEGGISGGGDAIPMEARSVQPTQFMGIDPVATPEGLNVGAEGRLTGSAKIGSDKRLYVPVRNVRTGEVGHQAIHDLFDKVIAFPGELKSGEPFVRTISSGGMHYRPRGEVDFESQSMGHAFSPLTGMVFAKANQKAHRNAMAQRMLTQALPLIGGEAPYVRSRSHTGKSLEEELGSTFGAVHAQAPGKVVKVGDDEIVVEHPDGKQTTHELHEHTPNNTKTFLHQMPIVKSGDRVNPGDLLATSNYTDPKGHAALGLNVRIAYMTYKGLNHEDASVISASLARRLSSHQLYQHELEVDDAVKADKRAYVASFPSVLTREKLKNYNDDGTVKKGTVIHNGDPLFLAVRKRDTSAPKLGGRPASSWQDASETWEHKNEGVVTDVSKTRNGYLVAVKTINPTEIADKLTGRSGDKGVISKIVDDKDMPHDSQGRPVEMIVSDLGMQNRVNASQLHESALGKIVAEKGVKPYEVDDFEHPDMQEFVNGELRKHGVSLQENLTDPTRGNATIPNVQVGNRFIMKLHHEAAAKETGRGVGAYTSEGVPSRGGFSGAKRFGGLNLSAALSHGSLEVVRDAVLNRGQLNPEMWRRFMAGHDMHEQEVPIVHRKLIASLQAAGINPVRMPGGTVGLAAATDKQVDEMAEGRYIDHAETVDWNKKGDPIPGGLFDERLGGRLGEKWSAMKLAGRLPSPVMEEPIRRLLGLTKEKFRDVVGGKMELGGRTGPDALHEALAAIDIPKEIAKQQQIVASGAVSKRDDAVKRIRFLRGAEKTGIHPGEWSITKVPILPPIYRPVSLMQGSKVPLVADANVLYRDLHAANDVYSKLKDRVEDSGAERLAVYDALKAVVGLGDPIQPKSQEKGAKGVLRQVFGSAPKYSTIQRKLLGASTDLVGRGVILPNPDLTMDQIGVPERMAWEIFKPFVVRSMVQQGNTMMDAARAVKDQTPKARQFLEEVMSERVVQADRAPVLHRYGVMAFHPKLVHGSAIHLHPLVYPGFGADNDGDAMQIHVPFSDAANNDAQEKMMPSKNLRAVKDFDVHLLPNKEFLTGLYQATTKRKKGGSSRVFHSAKDVVAAFERGEVDSDHQVTVVHAGKRKD